MDSTQHASGEHQMPLGCAGGDGTARAETPEPEREPAPSERGEPQTTSLPSLGGDGTARAETPEPEREPAPSERGEPQTTSLPSLGYLNSTAWGTMEDDIHLDEEFLLFEDAVQALPSADGEVVYYLGSNPTGVRDPNTGLEL